MSEAEGVPTPDLGAGGALAYRAFGEAVLLGACPPMLEFRFKTGAVLALGYAWLWRVEFDPSRGIELTYPDAVVTLRGRNLAPVFASVVRHHTRWVAEADRAALWLADAACVVEEITAARRDAAESRSRAW